MDLLYRYREVTIDRDSFVEIEITQPQSHTQAELWLVLNAKHGWDINKQAIRGYKPEDRSFVATVHGGVAEMLYDQYQKGYSSRATPWTEARLTGSEPIQC